MFNSKIIGVGKYLPKNVVSNADLEKTMDTSNEWIVERTGIQERRHIKKGDNDGVATMGVKASKIALDRAHINAQDIDLILLAYDSSFPQGLLFLLKTRPQDFLTCPFFQKVVLGPF